MQTRSFLHIIVFSLTIVSLATSCGRSVATPTDAPTVVPPVAPIVAQATTAPTPDPANFDRQAMLQAIADELILPSHAALVTESTALETAVNAFAAEPTPETLRAAQDAWLATADAWAAVEAYGLRFTMLIKGQLKKWPVNTHFIEEFLVEEPTIDAVFIESTGSTARGLGAVEYFLFDPNRSEQEIVDGLVAESKRMDYLVNSSADVAAKAAALYAMWAPEGDDQIAAFIAAATAGNDVQGSISLLANELVELAEEINQDKLDYPLRGVLAEAQPEAVESPYARHSIPLILTNLESMEAIFTVGLNDYLNFLQRADSTPVAPAITEKLGQIKGMLEALPMPLQDAVVEDPEAVRAIRDEVRALIVLLKVDMANQLGITITFNGSDGD